MTQHRTGVDDEDEGGGGTNMLTITRSPTPQPHSQNTSTAVPPNSEAHLECNVTQLIKSSWGCWWDTARGMLRLWKGPKWVRLRGVWISPTCLSVDVSICGSWITRVDAATCPLEKSIKSDEGKALGLGWWMPPLGLLRWAKISDSLDQIAALCPFVFYFPPSFYSL